MARGLFGLVAAALVGAAAGLVAGIVVAPNTSAEVRSKATGVMTDAWGNIVETCQQACAAGAAKAEQVREQSGLRTEDLREKVEQARARMDQVRASIANANAHVAEVDRAPRSSVVIHTDVVDVKPSEGPAGTVYVPIDDQKDSE